MSLASDFLVLNQTLEVFNLQKAYMKYAEQIIVVSVKLDRKYLPVAEVSNTLRS